MEPFTIILIMIAITVIVVIAALSTKTKPTETREPVNTFATIMPDEAVTEIRTGRLPRLTTDKIILSSGEYCHFIDKAYLIDERVLKSFNTTSEGASVPFIASIKVRFGDAYTNAEEIPVTDLYKGLLFITNRRIILVSKKRPFDKQFKTLTAKTAYSDGIEFQFGGKYVSLLVPDGKTASDVVDLVLARRGV
jgi:hypothetical protein